MKVLYLVSRETYDTKMSRVRAHQVDAIAAQVPVVISGPGWPTWDAGRTAAENVARIPVGDSGTPADVVLTYGVAGLAGCPVPTLTSFNEAFDVPKVTHFVQENRLRGVIFHHGNDATRYTHLWQDGIVTAHVPHCAQAETYRDYALEKDIDVLVAGNLSHGYYPFRVRLAALAWGTLRKRGYRVCVLRHPGYTLPPRAGTVVGAAFAQMLNRAKLVATCSMRFKYALAKYAEIGLCRSLAVADIPDERQEYFADTILAVHPWETDHAILDRIEAVLDDDEDRQRRTDRAWSLTQTTSTMSHYAERFLHVAQSVVNAGPR